MESGVNAGYLENAGRARTMPQSLAVAGTFTLEFPDEYDAFAFQISGAVAAARSVVVGFGKPDLSGEANPANALQVVDPTVVGAVRRLGRTTRWVTVYIVTATAGATLHVSGVEGDPVLRPPTAGEIAAAIAASTPPTSPATWVWSAPTAVAMGAASAVIIAANPVRKGFRIQNTGAVSVFFRKVASPAVVASDIELLPDAVYEEGEERAVYTGEVRGITAGAAGEVRIEEAT